MEKRFKKIKFGKWGLIVLVVVFIFMAATPFAKADSGIPNLFACATSPATCAIYFLSVVVQAFLTLLTMLAAFLIQIGLQVNGHIFDSPVVQTGFSVTLAFANLGFVFGIIVVALATILRSQTYGIKQVLWKLIAVAILVNFGLVITSPIVNFADSMTQFFLNTSGGGDGFIANMQTVLAPQSVNMPSLSNVSGNLAAGVCSAALLFMPGSGTLCNYLAQKAGLTPADTFWQTLSAVLFSIVLAFFIVIAEMGLAVLLWVRYVALGILLILLPLAWLTWVFPKFSSNASKWWKEFIRWTFFPPLAFFFIYLAFLTEAQTPNSNQTYMQLAMNIVPTGPALALATVMGFNAQAVTGLIQQAATEFMVIALMVGGLFAASSLAGSAGKVVTGAAKAVTNSVGGYIGKQSKKGARLAYQKAGGEKLTKNLREGNLGRVGRIPIVGGVLRRGASLTGAAVGSVTSNEAEVEAQKKKIPKSMLSEEKWSELAGSRNMETQLALISSLVDDGEFGELDKADNERKINGKSVRQYLNENLDPESDVAKRYAAQKLGINANKAVGSDKAMRDADDEVQRLRSTGAAAADVTRAMKNLDTATKDFVEKLQKTDVPKMSVNDVFGKETDLSKALAKAFLLYAPQLAPAAMPKMKSGTLKMYEKLYEDAHEQEGYRIRFDRNLSPDEKNRQTEILEKKWDAFQKSLANNSMSFYDPGAAAAPTATPPPTPPPAPTPHP